MSAKQSRYPEFARDAAKRGLAITGKPFHSMPASGEHYNVRVIAAEMIDGEPTIDAIMALTGVKSVAAMRRIAVGADRATAKTIDGELNRAVKDAPGNTARWGAGRYLAVILSVWIEEIQKAERTAKRAAKVAPVEPVEDAPVEIAA